MEVAEIKKNIEKILDDNKAQSITSINLKNKSYIADYMIIASGTSSRHLQSLSEILVAELKNPAAPTPSNRSPKSTALPAVVMEWYSMTSFGDGCSSIATMPRVEVVAVDEISVAISYHRSCA